ncbi:MAG TPA: MGMT family protein [Frankiaceae bacterium]|nr:MGMT family protein [Frankiaceae bacterium]
MGRTRPPESVSAGLATRGLISGGEPTPHAVEVLDVVARIPAGKVMTYGDVAEYVGRGSGRTVGAVMSRHGHEVPWHRVVLSTGHPNPAGPVEALARLRADGTPLLSDGERVDLKAARWAG